LKEKIELNEHELRETIRKTHSNFLKYLNFIITNNYNLDLQWT